MKAKQKIFICGDSVILGAVGASLRQTKQFEVIALASLPHSAQQFDTRTPGTLLFDLESPHTKAVFSLLETYPTLQLIGISPDINLVKFWAGRELRNMSTQDLFELIKNNINELSIESGGDEGRS